MRKIINRTVLVWAGGVVLISFALCSPASSEPIKLDLERAIVVALANNENYLIAKRELEKADGQVMEAVAGALPQITGGLTYLHNWRVPVGVFEMNGETVTFKFGTDDSYTADLTLTQPIYMGGRTFTALKIARTYKKMAREIVQSSRQNLKVSVFNGFYGALLAREIHRVNQDSYRFAVENLDVVESMYNQGMAAEYDLLRARVAVANLEPEIIRSENDMEVAESSLKSIMGLDLDTDIELEVDMDSSQFIVPPVDPESALPELKENRSELLIGGYETRLRKQLVSLSRAGYRPTLLFSSSLQYQAQFNEGSVFDKKWDRSLNSVLVLSVPIFDSWKTPSRVKQARVEYVQSQLKEDALLRSMVLDFEQSLGKYDESRRRFSTQGGAVELARRGLEIANVRYENGVGTQLEVSDARLALARAEINRAVAFHDLAVSYASLMRALGRDIELVE